LGWAGEKWSASGYSSPATLLNDRFEVADFFPLLIDNPENILKFKAYALCLHNQVRAGKALHARRVFSFGRDV
jgi:hypothetical protein